jgi:hypothetical protein
MTVTNEDNATSTYAKTADNTALNACHAADSTPNRNACPPDPDPKFALNASFQYSNIVLTEFHTVLNA